MGLLLMLKQLAKMTIAVQISCLLCTSLIVLVAAHDEPNNALCVLFHMPGMDVSCHIRLQARYCQNLHLMLLYSWHLSACYISILPRCFRDCRWLRQYPKHDI